LSDWIAIGTVLSTNSTTVFADPLGQAPYRFYRLKAPGTTVQQAQSIWNNQRIRAYSFRLQRISLDAQLEAVGTVTDGINAITKVTNLVTGEKVNQFDPNNFLDITEMFALLAQAENDGVWSATIEYDPQLSFPKRVMLHRVSDLSDEIIHYEMELIASEM
jgi:hypothetical protein